MQLIDFIPITMQNSSVVVTKTRLHVR